MQRESVLQKQCMDFCKKNCTLVFKVESQSVVGFPDLLVITPQGDTIYIELKTSIGKLSAMQKRLHKKMRENNARVYVCRTLTEFKEAIEA